MQMRIFTLVVLCAFARDPQLGVAQNSAARSSAQEVESNHGNWVDRARKFTGEFATGMLARNISVTKGLETVLLVRVLHGLHISHMDLEETALGKPSRPVIPERSSFQLP
eukprot:gnl/TRDRNA2_/TRDRNA2_130703_c0_seq1.p2 gnl/TRDRNA2_/TRDRNA2_130703_c0~~gnl/TRDRNA2_/TRDRNA2_130703_c0_seq1.p2  ORF type:complete len:110 (+),score=12.30 gnl/TRDRNA2_/TRDRNA2_130703_c0_seq1:40-369(+)